MILSLREIHGFRRLGIVAGLVLALLAFPCGPVATAIGSQAGHALAAVSAQPGHGEAECDHGAKKHENSCCNDCSSWLTNRIDNGTAAVVNQASTRDLPTIAAAYTPALYVRTDQEQRLTGPPPTVFLDGTSIYSKTKRYRI